MGKSISDLPDAKAIPARENSSVCCRSRSILRCCLAICRGSGCGRIIRRCAKRGIWTLFCATRISVFAGSKAIPGRCDVLQEMGRKRHIALSLPGFEQSLFMAAQPDHTLIATAPRYCQHYNQLHQLPLVARPLPFDAQRREKLMVPFTLLWHKRNSHNPKIVWLRQAINALCRRLI